MKNQQFRKRRQSAFNDARSRPTRVTQDLDKLVQQTQAAMTYQLPKVLDVPLIPTKNKIYTFTRTQQYAGIVGSATIETDGAYAFKLVDFPNSSEFTSLFDEYRCIQIVADFVPRGGNNSGAASICTVIDYDDSSTIAIADAFQYQTLQMNPTGSTFRRVFNPKVSNALYSGAFTSFGNVRQWIDVASNSVLHYGLKYSFPAVTTAATYWDVFVTATWQFRNVR